MGSFRNLFLLLFCFALLYLLCNAQKDSINQSQYVSDGQTLVSTSETFVLGFFSPSATTQNRYLGIWFNPKKFSSQTIVWVANRENPITDSSGVFKITRDGNPVILDSNGSLIWSANPSIAIRNGSIAKLLDSGNLILIDGNSHIITWQSFDEPCDTLLQGMKMGMVGISSKKQFLTSWESPENPASGSFSFGIDTHGLNQLVLWEGNKKRWRSGGTFIGIPGMSNFISNGFMLVSDNRGDDYVTLSQSLGPSSVITKFVIDSFGFLKQTDWIEGSNDWNVSFSKPIAQCEVYGQCGPNGVCNQNGSPICSCLDGFVPKSPLDWTVGRWSDGCLRRTKLDCEKNSSSGSKGGDGFKRLISMKLPDHSNWVAVGHFKGCRDTCVKNCSCIGYAFVDGIGCMVSFGELIDLQRFPNGGLDFYLRLAASEIGEESIILVLPLVIALSMPLLAGLGEAIRRETQTRRNSKSKDKEKSSEFLLLNLRTSIDGREKQGEMTIFDLSEIVGATNNFSIENKLGQGGFGPVYKGMFQDGQQIAVKRLSKSSSQGLEEFKNEVMLISKLQHRNLVKLFGCCVEVEEKLLIYEYMPNKSLDAMLFDPMRGALLDWRKRFDIIEGIARGLLYLHRDSRLRIIHRDLKASNILLDDQMNPKISDFGMARIFGGNETQENTQRVVGTYGYMSPEYAMEGRFSEKSDVFSFGVLLLEIISGKRNTRFYHLELCLNLVGYAWLLWNEGKGMELVDPLLADSFNTDEILKCIHLALLCVQDGPTDRPTMSSIMIMLGSDAATLPSPKQPTFTVERCHVGSNLSNKNAKIHSIADLTITVVEGR